MSARALFTSQSLRSAALGRVALRSQAAQLSTSARLGLKESSSQTNEDYDKHKQDSLAKQKQGQGHWKRELASDSEEAVKAEREPAGKEDIANLQKRTQAAAEETHKAGTSTRDGL